jgi:hypothetical protein
MAKNPDYTTEEDNTLRKFYFDATHQELTKLFPDRSVVAIHKRARRLGLKKNPEITEAYNRTCELSNLLLETPLAYYQMGFIAADGCFTKSGGICISVNEKDTEWLKNAFENVKFNFYSHKHSHEYKNEIKYSVQSSLQGNDNKNYFKIQDKFDLQQNKTLYPPQNFQFYKSLPNDLFLSFLIGLIDGDGCIHKKKNNTVVIQVCCHKNWGDFFAALKEKIESIFNLTVRVSPPNRKDNCIILIMHKFPILRELKKCAIKLNLPIMKRKWDNINVNHITYYEKAEMKFEKVKELLDSGKSFKESARIVNLNSYLTKKIKIRLGLPLETRKSKNT